MNEQIVAVRNLKDVIVDTTVMEKNICHPTDARLYFRLRERFVKLARKKGVILRQPYTFVAKQALVSVSRYVHARQMKRARKKAKELKTYLRRVYRDVRRKVTDELKKAFQPLFIMADRLLYQTKEAKDKLYSIHAPEVECISKGKAHKKFEFGCKVSLVVTHKEGLALKLPSPAWKSI